MIELHKYHAVLFDLDGVLTPTAEIHMRAWAEVFTELFERENHPGRPVAPYQEQDYFDYLDGKPRFEGVQSLLQSRELAFPWGEMSDTSVDQTVCGVGNLKNEKFLELLQRDTLRPYPGSLAFLEYCLAEGILVAVVSSSKNARAVLHSAGILDKFSVIVDGLAVESGHLRGKPEPDMFLAAAQQLETQPHRAMVIEDAQVGVAAASAGDFGCVVGVNRSDEQQAERLVASGADIVVNDLTELMPRER